MTPVQSRGRSRLLLRLPAWRAELRDAKASQFLEICEAYELTWDAVAYWSRCDVSARVQEYRQLADSLEVDALMVALGRTEAAMGEALQDG